MRRPGAMMKQVGLTRTHKAQPFQAKSFLKKMELPIHYPNRACSFMPQRLRRVHSCRAGSGNVPGQQRHRS